MGKEGICPWGFCLASHHSDKRQPKKKAPKRLFAWSINSRTRCSEKQSFRRERQRIVVLLYLAGHFCGGDVRPEKIRCRRDQLALRVISDVDHARRDFWP